MVRFPHLLYASVVSESTQDTDGNWQPSTPTESEPMKCRYEPASGNSIIPGADGSQITYSGIVYMPQDAEMLQVGTKIRIERPDDADVVSDVKRFARSQKNCRVWL